MPDTSADIIREKFAQRLQHELAIRNWNQSDLAREASKHLAKGGLARDNVSNYCNAKALPGPGFLLALAKALNTTPDDLLPERGAAVPKSLGPLPSTDVRDLGEGRAFLRVNKNVPWSVAVKVLEILNEDRKKDLAEQGYPADNR